MNTKMKTVLLEEADLTQLKEFATNSLGLEFPRTANTVHMLSMIRQVHTKDTIEVADEDAYQTAEAGNFAPAQQVQRTTGKDMKAVKSGKDPKVTINIPLSEKEGGDRPVTVGVNGQIMLLPRGEDITIPYRYYEALRNARKSEFSQDPNDNNHEIKERIVPSYPFEVKAMPSKDEIDAWLQGMQERA